MRTPLIIATAMTLLASPALARDVAHAEVFTDSNSHYLDYKTSISEAKRELRKDLARANDEADRIDAIAEYEAEIADAEKDFRKEMAERGVVLPKGSVIVEEDVAVFPQ
ncbi:hypothetical protein [Sphingomonas sp. J315]|uniref:hypothetical protein n=2 Tax=unclassified Sphingomonas TaxID=196159 RepID=UPI0021AD654C|nr:hypothetical protein [Sphingomonas sp. J315]UUX98137.1 hypothetical protein LRS08_10965 [Sphingomonas sp. J315]